MLTSEWSFAGIFTFQSGTPFSVLGAATRNAYFAQVSRVRVSFAPGMALQDAVKSGRTRSARRKLQRGGIPGLTGSIGEYRT
jgi:hypothetical protein